MNQEVASSTLFFMCKLIVMVDMERMKSCRTVTGCLVASLEDKLIGTVDVERMKSCRTITGCLVASLIKMCSVERKIRSEQKN